MVQNPGGSAGVFVCNLATYVSKMVTCVGDACERRRGMLV